MHHQAIADSNTAQAVAVASALLQATINQRAGTAHNAQQVLNPLDCKESGRRR